MEVEVCPLDELPPGTTKLVAHGALDVGVYNCGGELYAIEDRCSHDDGPLAEGPFDADACTVECPRHGSLFDLTSGRPKTLPAYQPVPTYPVTIEDRCSHDDGPLAEGPFDADACTVECPRHGSLFDLTSGRPKTLPAYQPVTTYPVTVEDDTVKLEVY